MALGSTSFRLTESTVVAADPRLVERFLLDPGCFTVWRRGVSGEVRASTPVLQTGTAVEFTGQAGPLRFPYVTIVSEHVPGRNIALRTTQGVIDLDVDVRWEPAGGGTRVETVVDGRCTEAKAWLVPLVRSYQGRNLRLNLAELKRILERGQFRFTVPSTLTGHPPHCTQSPPPELF